MKTKQEQVPGPVYQERSQTIGPPPTIGDFRRRGMTGFTVHCLGLNYCGHRERFAFSDLRLADDMVFLDIAKQPFRCTGCGTRRKVEVSPDWTEVR